MGTARSNQETGDQERSDGRGGHIGVRVGEVVEHSKPQQGVADGEETTGNDGRPKGGVAVAGEAEPEQGDGEAPYADEGGEETRLGAVGAVLEAVLFVEVGLDGDDAEHDGNLRREEKK